MQVDPCGPRHGASAPESRVVNGATAGTAGRATGTNRFGTDAAACAINEHAPASGGRAGRAKYPLIRQSTANIRSDREVPE
ncbi:hypothetical protein GCM10010182_46810 [Actinomadura cremea]|nr:hypothetical protein GCM10010182_46810 [Actinomadura cremea]